MSNSPQVQLGNPDNQETPQLSDPQNQSQNPDVEMNEAQEPANGREGDVEAAQEDVTITDTQPAPEPEPADPPTPAKKNPLRFLDYLVSPIVELIVGQGEDQTTLSAHQNMLTESPYLTESIENFTDSSPRRITLSEENVDAFGSFLQFQYTRDYYSQDQETTTTTTDDGEELLKHARVYTLAEKLGIPALKTLAHSKIHRINSTPQGEIVYARYVYTHTPSDDTTIRRPVAAFWAARSHVLRHEAEEAYRKLCLEVPEFCFDVLSLVLDQKEKRAHDRADAESGTKSSGRKRLRSGV